MAHFKCITKIAKLLSLLGGKGRKGQNRLLRPYQRQLYVPYPKTSLHKASHGGQFGPRRNWRIRDQDRTNQRSTDGNKEDFCQRHFHRKNRAHKNPLWCWESFSFLAKGQLISEWLFVFFNFPKIQHKYPLSAKFDEPLEWIVFIDPSLHLRFSWITVPIIQKLAFWGWVGAMGIWTHDHVCISTTYFAPRTLA